MEGKPEREGLSLGYRIVWRIKLILLTFYGPPRLDENQDPITRLRRERADKVAAARAAQAQGTAPDAQGEPPGTS